MLPRELTGRKTVYVALPNLRDLGRFNCLAARVGLIGTTGLAGFPDYHLNPEFPRALAGLCEPSRKHPIAQYCLGFFEVGGS